MNFRLQHAALLWLLAIAVYPAIAAAQERDHARFLLGLRQRQLFELAENYCSNELARLQPVDRQRADLTVELIRTYSAHAANAPPGERDALWKAARTAAADFARASPEHPRSILVRFADALVPLAQGELVRHELEAGAAPADKQQAGLAALREATALLDSLQSELTREIPLRRRASPRPGELSGDQLFALQQQARYQYARAQRNRALCFAAGSDDRLALLLDAVNTLEQLLSQLAADAPLAPAIQLDLAECQRLLGRFDEAEKLAAPLASAGVQPAIRLRARAELLRIAIVQQQPAAVQQLLAEGRQIEGQDAAELDFAWFEAWLYLARAVRDGSYQPAPEAATNRAKRPSGAELAGQFEKHSAAMAESLEQAHGAYWSRRANQLLAAALPRGGAGAANAELLSRAADSLYLKGEFGSAISAYDEAAAAARTGGDMAAAFDLSYKAALVEQRRGSHADASHRLRILARSLATHEQAPAAHLLAAWNAAQLARKDASAADGYAAILREHLATFSRAESANQARLWLGQWHEQRQGWPAAIAAYGDVTPASKQFGEAIEALARCWPRQLASLAAAGQPTKEPAAEAIEFFRSASEHDVAAALAAARLILVWQPDSAGEAERLLKTTLDSDSAESAEWRAAAQSQLVVALASQNGREENAQALLGEMDAASAQLLEVLRSLSTIVAGKKDDQRRKVALVQLAVAARLAPSRAQLSAAEQTELARLEADALAAAGRRGEAVIAYAALAKAQPDSESIQQGYAKLLLSSDEPGDWKLALERWRLIASRTKPQTKPWHWAKYSVALAQFKLGDREGAARLLQFVLETSPPPQGSEEEAAYQQLLQKCAPRAAR